MKIKNIPQQKSAALFRCFVIILICLPLFVMASSDNGINNNNDYVTSNDTYLGKAEIVARKRVTLTTGFRALSGCSVRVYTDLNAEFPDNTYDPDPGNTPVNASPSNNQNYIVTTTLKAPVVDVNQISQTAHVQVVEYFDGLGRPLQTVVPKGSPDMKDLVTHISYDAAGRVDKKHLSYKASGGTGQYYGSAASDVITFYETGFPGREADSKPYATPLYDNSPLNRITGEIGIGSAWENHPSSITYSSNTGAIQHWKVTGVSPAVFTSFSYSSNSLYVVENTDEDGLKSLVYTDKIGQKVRVESLDEPQTVLRTSYIYDDFGLLRCVVPPKATGPQNIDLCYFYNYDERGRLIEKRLPGADWIYYIYDKRDRIAMWQDGELRTGHKWHFQLYDALNRPVVSGIQYLSEQNIEAIRNNFKLHTGNLYEEWTSGGPLYGYSNSSFPVAYRPNAGSVLTISWYDNYDFKQLPEIGTAYNFPPIPPGGSTSSQYRTRVKGLITGNLERIDGLQGAGLINVNYYDERLRPICTVSDNHLDGRNNTFTAYDFNDNITETVTSHYINGQQEQQLVLITRYAYDHQSRLLEEKLKFNDQDFITLRAMEYNAIGDLINTYLHKSATGQGFNQKVSNTYNIRGWLSKINDADNPGHSLFALDLRYQNPATAVIQPKPYYNGNISQMQWNGKYDQKRAYGFEYDHLNRIKQADYADGAGNTSNAGYYSTAYAYDPNGNITHLDRKKENNSIDQLIYTYASNSNLLQAVNDESGITEGYAPNSGSYGYDASGNMKYDPSKRIFVHYNHLNLPTNIEFDSDDYITYSYTPTGRKLSKSVNTWHTPETSETDYCGPIVYHNSEIHSIFTSAGRIVPIQLAGEVLWQNEYNLTDHLGNVRVVFAAHSNGQPEVMQQTSYYPFGMTMQQQNFGGTHNQPNKLLYNGKELQDDELAGVSLDWYDYGARFYDAALGRWHVVDPMASNAPGWSPYNSMWNNPILNIDPDGRWAGDYYKKDGTYIGSDGIDDNKVYLADGTSTSEDGSTAFNNSQELSITHTEFQTISGIVNHEAGTSDPNENLWIAHTANNAAGQSGVSLYDKLMSGYSSAPSESKVPLGTSANSSGANASRAGVLNVLSGGADPTGGSTLWDGTDFLAWGLNSPYGGKPHAKYRQYSNISVSGDIYNSYLNGALNKYPKGRVRYFGEYYNIPAPVFDNKANWTDGNFNYNTGYKRSFGIKATGAFGHSIFWKRQ